MCGVCVGEVYWGADRHEMRSSDRVRSLDTPYESPEDSPLVRSLSPVLSLGAATLADMYEPRERGTMMGIYYR